MTETTPIPVPAAAASPAVSAPSGGGASAPAFSPLPGESARAFEAFRAYLELGPRRRYAAVARKIGASLRTVKRLANDFAWRNRIKACALQEVALHAQAENDVHREACLDAAARAKAFRDRQYSLAEAILDAAERYLECADFDDLDQMTFADACKALEVASRLAHQANEKITDDSSAPARNLRDQLASLLDQAYGDSPAKNGAGDQPHAAPPPPTPSPALHSSQSVGG